MIPFFWNAITDGEARDMFLHLTTMSCKFIGTTGICQKIVFYYNLN